MPNKPPAEMSLAEVRDELRRVTGTAWSDEAAGPYRQLLWKRLDALVAAGEQVSASEGERRDVRTYDPSLGTCRCPSEPARVPVPHAYRHHAVTGEYVLVCTRCGALWDHKQTDEIIRAVQAATFAAKPDAPLPSPDSGAQRPPDLQELVARYGGYNRITPEAWAKYDRAVAEWKASRGIGIGVAGKNQP
jgi:hypothetical protein